MALTKSSASIVSGQTASTTTAAADVSGAYAAAIGVQIVQVGTAGTGATWKAQVSYDGGTTYYDDTAVVQAPGAAGTYTWTHAIPEAATHVRLVYVQQSGGTSSTLSAEVGRVTAL